VPVGSSEGSAKYVWPKVLKKDVHTSFPVAPDWLVNMIGHGSGGGGDLRFTIHADKSDSPATGWEVFDNVDHHIVASFVVVHVGVVAIYRQSWRAGHVPEERPVLRRYSHDRVKVAIIEEGVTAIGEASYGHWRPRVIDVTLVDSS